MVELLDEEEEALPLAPAVATVAAKGLGACQTCACDRTALEAEKKELARRRAIMEKNEAFLDIVKARVELARIKADIAMLHNSPVLFRIEDEAKLIKSASVPGVDVYVYPSGTEPASERYRPATALDVARTCSACGCKSVGVDCVCTKCGKQKRAT